MDIDHKLMHAVLLVRLGTAPVTTCTLNMLRHVAFRDFLSTGLALHLNIRKLPLPKKAHVSVRSKDMSYGKTFVSGTATSQDHSASRCIWRKMIL